MMDRRNFVRASTLGLLGLACAPDNHRSDPTNVKSPDVTIYVALQDNSVYSREAFDLASDYFRERVGLKFDFRLGSREDIPDTLDKRTTFAMAHFR